MLICSECQSEGSDCVGIGAMEVEITLPNLYKLIKRPIQAICEYQWTEVSQKGPAMHESFSRKHRGTLWPASAATSVSSSTHQNSGAQYLADSRILAHALPSLRHPPCRLPHPKSRPASCAASACLGSSWRRLVLTARTLQDKRRPCEAA